MSLDLTEIRFTPGVELYYLVVFENQSKSLVEYIWDYDYAVQKRDYYLAQGKDCHVSWFKLIKEGI